MEQQMEGGRRRESSTRSTNLDVWSATSGSEPLQLQLEPPHGASCSAPAADGFPAAPCRTVLWTHSDVNTGPRGAAHSFTRHEKTLRGDVSSHTLQRAAQMAAVRNVIIRNLSAAIRKDFSPLAHKRFCRNR
ncbi:hypothetical protein EYF80_046753 [Liparis tanakae]|uniref:Uncharacterized protein n=1 Tax=Liparis tanakae TaxID=230148 RepID=A0A4Z2FQT1_9TELE|nr:hypothetical protein EYF80_046753 [Liparis tanakae]